MASFPIRGDQLRHGLVFVAGALAVLAAACSGSVTGSAGNDVGDAGSGDNVSSGDGSSVEPSPGTSDASNDSDSANAPETTPSDGPRLTPDTYIAGVVGPGTENGINDASACNMQSDLTWEIGLGISPKPSTYSDGSSEAGGAVHVYCSVDPSGGGFLVNLSGALIGAYGGSVSVSGFVNATGSTSGLRGIFATMGQQFVDNNCTFTQTYNNSPLPSGGAPASGRIWGHIDCPNAVENGMFGVGIDGGPVLRMCEASADFLFENCN